MVLPPIFSYHYIDLPELFNGQPVTHGTIQMERLLQPFDMYGLTQNQESEEDHPRTACLYGIS